MLSRLFTGHVQTHAFNVGFVDPIGALIGKLGDALPTMAPFDGAARVDPDQIDLTATPPKAERYCSIERGRRQPPQSVFSDEVLTP
ncbi:hypothetical protein [Lysobacter sp. CA199]|uniref:hypothetical protein n=1 Tax=Lysobacter sp. CA199 TaxID=3455608 RepID=UPI003F8D0D76